LLYRNSHPDCRSFARKIRAKLGDGRREMTFRRRAPIRSSRRLDAATIAGLRFAEFGAERGIDSNPAAAGRCGHAARWDNSRLVQMKVLSKTLSTA